MSLFLLKRFATFVATLLAASIVVFAVPAPWIVRSLAVVIVPWVSAMVPLGSTTVSPEFAAVIA